MGDQSNLEVLQKWVSVGDSIEAMLELMHPSVVVKEAESLPYGGRYDGHDGFRSLISHITDLAEMTEGTMTYHEAGDKIIGELPITFTSGKTGDSLETSVVEIYSFQDGLISEVDVYYKDTAAVNELLGR